MKRLPLRAATLFSKVPRGAGPGVYSGSEERREKKRKYFSRLLPNCPPPLPPPPSPLYRFDTYLQAWHGTFEAKIAALKSSCSIPTILQGTGDCEQSANSFNE